MFVKKIHTLELQNEEHAKFVTEFDEVLSQSDQVLNRVMTEYNVFKPLLANEYEALDNVRKSSITAQIDAADFARDRPIKGFFKVVKGLVHHFNLAISEAAGRAEVIIDNFAGITKLSNKKQSSATKSMLAQLKGTAAADIDTLQLSDWVAEIEARENAFLGLETGRYDEKDSRTRLRMKEVRILIDDATDAIVNKINALVIVEGEADYVTLINKLNLRIETYANVIAQRKGIAVAAKNKKKGTDTASTNPVNPA